MAVPHVGCVHRVARMMCWCALSNNAGRSTRGNDDPHESGVPAMLSR